MAQPSNVTEPPLVSVIGPQFVVSYEFKVIIDRHSGGSLVITDADNKILFTLKSCDSSLHFQWLLRDANDTPIALLRKKNISLHNRWNVYKGESNNGQDIIFSIASNHTIQSKTHLKVSLANITRGRDDCDFTIKGEWSKKNCKIYMGDSSTVIAQMDKMKPPANKDKFMVTINPMMDYAFVVSLIAIVHAMDIHRKAGNKAAAEGTAEGVAAVFGALFSG
ncbi:hypothetical protein R6Q59_018367 [Mikania micrantha]|uniref:Tubby C-terminal domain-containing protein n=1 Tax=Mikania micrantha TaxID=192012 RepID=A0A5N6M1G4_9ASTR|nr:hypothetical protein E3N88_35482 [Mikania micrantha]